MQRYYPRTIEKILPLASARFKVVMLQGVRVSGKRTVLMHLAGDRNRVVLPGDDALMPEAKADPRGFFESLRAPAVVEGIDRVPEHFRPLKSVADRSPERGLYWVTSSQRIELMTELEDKLPGRLLPLDLLPWSLAEREGRGTHPDTVSAGSHAGTEAR